MLGLIFTGSVCLITGFCVGAANNKSVKAIEAHIGSIAQSAQKLLVIHVNTAQSVVASVPVVDETKTSTILPFITPAVPLVVVDDTKI